MLRSKKYSVIAQKMMVQTQAHIQNMSIVNEERREEEGDRKEERERLKRSRERTEDGEL